MRAPTGIVCVLGTLVLLGPVRGADLAPEARQVQYAYSDLFRRLPGSAKSALNAWLAKWPSLKPAEREAVVHVLERLVYLPSETIGSALQGVGEAGRRDALLALSKDDRVFEDEPPRAMVVVAGIGAPAPVTVGADRERALPRTWGHVRREGLLVANVTTGPRARTHPRWAASLLCGQAVPAEIKGRPQAPTLLELVRKARGLAETDVWLVTTGPAFERAAYSTAPGYGRETGALLVSASLFTEVAHRRRRYIEQEVEQGTKRAVAEHRARRLGAEALGIDTVYPDPAVCSFVWDRMWREYGVGTWNTFVYITSLRAIRAYRPHVIVTCFGEPAYEHAVPLPKPNRSDARDAADYERNVHVWQARMAQRKRDLPQRRREAVTNLDVYIDYLYREFRRNPWYGPRGMFILVLGDPGLDAIDVIVVSPQTPRNGLTRARHLLAQVAPTVAQFMRVAVPEGTATPIPGAFVRPTSGPAVRP